MVSLLVDFGSFGPFLSPCCDESFLEAVGPPRSWANKDFPQQIQKHRGMKTMETKRAQGFLTSKFDGHPDSSLLAVIRWSLLDVLPLCTFAAFAYISKISKIVGLFCTGSFQRLPVRV